MRAFVPVLVLLVASVGRADDLVGRFRLDAVDDQGRWRTGTLEVTPEGAATRALSDAPKRGRARRVGGGFVVDFGGRGAGGLVGLGQADGPGSAAAWRAEYRDDGRGGFVGASRGPDGPLTETLTPLVLDPASLEPALAPLRRKQPSEADARRVVDLARAARAEGPRSARALVEALRAERLLYRALDAASDDDRRALAAIVAEVAPPLPAQDPAFERAFAAVTDLEAYEFPLLVVPGYTPTDASRLHDLHAIARKRCERAAADFHAGRAPFVLVTGGAVHPEDTPVIEAVQLRAELVRLGVPAERIAIDAAARHSTTNLRNAARFMLARGLDRALVITSFGQSFYFSSPRLSTFHRRARGELGYEVGRMRRVDLHRTAFFPDPRALTPGDDPLDP